ncbi:hypothetical protein ACIQTU_08610 [Brevundimonas sp. NPDC090276]|uniref:hypothetical protein n=1 Tax=Brevundimonas sp. NPDC090276 TaxID=3363956 RepID=UPI00383B1611
MTVEAVTTAAAQAGAIDWNALLVAGIGLGGVLVGAAGQHIGNELAWRRQREIARQNEARDCSLAALALAEHLEAFMEHCMDVVTSYGNVLWKGPYSWDEDTGGAPKWLDALTEWPALVDWKLLGVDLAVRSANFQRRVRLEKKSQGANDNASMEENHPEVADLAASLGLEAWDLACSVRKMNKLGAYEWPASWSGVADLREHIRRRAELKAERQARYEAWRASQDANPPV